MKDAAFFCDYFRDIEDQMSSNEFESIIAVFKHYKEILTQNKYKEWREKFLDIFKSLISPDGLISNHVQQFVFKPVNNPLIRVKPFNFYDVKYHHLEYFPIINQRVFQIGG